MKSKGFTLIELLAVIVILAIIALIAVPIITNIINESKESANKRSVELYGKAVENAIAKEELNKKKIPAGRYSSSDDGTTLTQIVTADKTPVVINAQYEGSKVRCGINKIYENGKIFLSKCTVENGTKEYSYGTNPNPLEPELLSVPETEGQIGAKYSIKVNKTKTYNFYILSIDNVAGTVSLIMDRNICIGGDTTYTSDNNYCRYAWHAGSNNNNYGPDTAMINLYNATKDWINVPDMIIDNYTDENNDGVATKGYIGIITNPSTKVTTITGKNGATNTNIGNATEPLKARLPMEIEITNTGCTRTHGSCLEWLVDNLKYDSTYKYSNNSANTSGTAIYNIDSYWLLSSYNSASSTANGVCNVGRICSANTSITDKRGIRAVITIPQSYLN